MQTRFSSARICALAVVASFVGTAQAQSFFEGFEPGPVTPGVAAIPATWTSVNNSVGGPGTNPNWQVRNDGAVFPAFAGTTYAFANYNSATGANDISNYLISPLVVLNNGDTISFYTSTIATPAFADRLELVYNTTGSTLPADFTNVLLTINPTLTTAGYPTSWTQFTATISGLAGPTAGRFAFHYNPTNGGPSGANSDYIGIDDVSYTSVGGGSLATNTTLGTGCGASFNSFYEFYADAAAASAALQGNALQLIATPNGYVGNWIPGGAVPLFVPPVAPTTLATGDDGDVVVNPSVALSTPYGPQASLRVTGNGIIGFGATAQDFPGTLSYDPTAAGFLNSANGGIYAWHDFNSSEAGSGSVLSEEISGVLYITYNGVENYASPEVANPSTLQIQLDLASGNVMMVWTVVDANITSTFGTAHLVGVTAPGASLDSGSTNLAASTLVTVNPEVQSLALAGVNRPIQGVATQNWNLNATNLPVGVGVDIIGLVDPGITNLALFGLGQNGCQLRATLDVTGAFLAGGAHSWSIPIPGGAPSLTGVQLFTQTAVLDFAINLANTLTTNGIQGTIGTF